MTYLNPYKQKYVVRNVDSDAVRNANVKITFMQAFKG